MPTPLSWSACHSTTALLTIVRISGADRIRLRHALISLSNLKLLDLALSPKLHILSISAIVHTDIVAHRSTEWRISSNEYSIIFYSPATAQPAHTTTTP